MNVKGKFLLVFLCLSITSYGLSGSVYASSHNILPLTIGTDAKSYSMGDTIIVSGHIINFDPTKGDVSIIILDPKGNFVTIQQITPTGNVGDVKATFSFTTVAGGLMKLTGEYTVQAKWNAQPAETMFEFVGGVVLEPEPVDDTAAEEAAAKAAAAAAAAKAAAAAAAAAVEAEPEIEPEPVMVSQPAEEKKGGGCLIATAAFGSEMAPQVQFLREIRDNTVLQTESGSAFMTGFNQFYYSFSPAVADYERENPAFKETVKLALTPMLTSLAILNYVDIDSEAEMLGYGIGIILLNIGMYFVAPAIIIIKIKNRN